MSEKELEKIADNAKIIVNGYAFSISKTNIIPNKCKPIGQNRT